jgi:riboflavin kinase/FMN adenylyltransferase
MRHVQTLDSLPLRGAWVTIGSFDGVHIGHQAVVSSLVSAAHKANAPAVVLTFYPHPAAVLRRLNGPFYLTTPQERAERLGKLGADWVITLPFTQELARQEAETFIQQLKQKLDLCCLWVGHDFALGHNRSGNIETLSQLSQRIPYQLKIIAPVQIKGQIVSSSIIRQAILNGDVHTAATWLGRPYDLSGTVIPGDQRGRTIGFPTANLETWPERLLPRNGVYATWAYTDHGRWPSVSNIGLRPTFELGTPQPRVETHLLDFDGDLYGQTLRIEFIRYLRPEQRFQNPNQLIQQIHQDSRSAREVFAHVS